MSTQLAIECFVAEPGRLGGAEANLDIFPADPVDVADHFSATFFYYRVGEKTAMMTL